MLKKSLCILTIGTVAFASCVPFTYSEEEETTALGVEMDDMNGAYRRLRRQIDNPAKNEDSLKRVTILLKAAKASAKSSRALASRTTLGGGDLFVSSNAVSRLSPAKWSTPGTCGRFVYRSSC